MNLRKIKNMSNDATGTLQITISTDAQQDTDDNIILESESDKEKASSTVTMDEILEMIELAKSGQSARTYKRDECRIILEDETFITWFDFYIWPTRMDLRFTLSTSNGELSHDDEVIDPTYTEFNKVFDFTNVVELDFVLTQVPPLKWDGDVYNKKFEVVFPKPTVTIEDNKLKTEFPVFGTLRVKGRKNGFTRRVTITLDKDNLKAENLETSVTVEWGDDKHDILELEAQQCVEDVLGWCENPFNPLFGPKGVGEKCTTEEGEEGTEEVKVSYTAYYSKCSGDPIMIVQDDNEAWCKEN
jgi:hypothetical protein